ncbi:MULTISPECIES: hypothetical protein [unclassified Streptomyces]
MTFRPYAVAAHRRRFPAALLGMNPDIIGGRLRDGMLTDFRPG